MLRTPASLPAAQTAGPPLGGPCEGGLGSVGVGLVGVGTAGVGVVGVGVVRGLPLSPGSSGARIHWTILPLAITKSVRAVWPTPPAQLLPPGPRRAVRLNSALTKRPRWLVETSIAPQGSAALATSASRSVWISTASGCPAASTPLTSKLGVAK